MDKFSAAAVKDSQALKIEADKSGSVSHVEHLFADSFVMPKSKITDVLTKVGDARTNPGDAGTKAAVKSTEASKPAEGQSKAQAKDRVIDISETDKIFGWWQKKQYADIGVQKIHLLPNRVELDLKAHTEKYNTLGLDKKVAFDFQTTANGWTLTDVQGLSLKGAAITRIESNAKKITFYTGAKANDYGGSVNDYIKALFDPLMRKELRN